MGPFGNFANQHCQPTLPNSLGPFGNLAKPTLPTNIAKLIGTFWQTCQTNIANQHCQTHWDLLATLPNQHYQPTLPNPLGPFGNLAHRFQVTKLICHQTANLAAGTNARRA
jgi:hypothetical protein